MTEDQHAPDAEGIDIRDLVADDVPAMHISALPVVVEGEVVAREVASNFGGITTLMGVDGQGAQAVSRDPRRRTATIVGYGGDVRIGRSQAAAKSSGGRWPANVPWTTTAIEELWVAPWDPANVPTIDVTVISERWT